MRGDEGLGSLGSMVPVRTPRAILARLNAEFRKAVERLEGKERLGQQGAAPLSQSLRQLRITLEEGVAKWVKAVRASTVRAN